MTNLTITATEVAAVEIIEQITAPAAVAISAGQAVRWDPSTGKLTLADAGETAEARAKGIALKSVGANVAVTAVKRGVLDLGDALGDCDYDDDIYLSNTSGTLATTTGTVAKTIGQVEPAWGHTTPDKLLRVEL